ncbi:MAG: biotin/lipoyl-binding protein, partial [Algoriphagus sp.]
MEILLLIIYSGIVWLIFFKFKLLPWNTVSQVIVITIPVVAITMLILLLNIYAPSSHDVRVMNYTVEIVPTVTGQVIEVPVEPNQHVKKGDVLFKIDPEPFELKIKNLEARIPMLEAKVISARAYDRELESQLATANSRIKVIQSQLDLAIKRLEQNKVLAESGAGSKFDYEQAQTNLANFQAQIAVAEAEKSQVLQKMSATSSDGELSEIAQARADLEQAKAQVAQAEWDLSQTTFYA